MLDYSLVTHFTGVVIVGSRKAGGQGSSIIPWVADAHIAIMVGLVIRMLLQGDRPVFDREIHASLRVIVVV